MPLPIKPKFLFIFSKFILKIPVVMVDTLPNLLPPIAAVAVYLGGIVLISELLSRFWAVDGEITRKVVHIGTGNVILLAWWLQIPAWVGICCSVLASIVTLISYKLPILPGVNSIGRKSFGTFFYAVSMGILVWYFWGINQPQYAAIGILTMSYGDGMAALIGQRFGKHPYKIGGIIKSWEGSLTMLVISYFICHVILTLTLGSSWQNLLISILLAISATGLESLSWWGIDNLTVPVGSAFISYALVDYFLVMH